MKTNTFFGLMGIIVIAAVVAIVASCGGKDNDPVCQCPIDVLHNKQGHYDNEGCPSSCEAKGTNYCQCENWDSRDGIPTVLFISDKENNITHEATIIGEGFDTVAEFTAAKTAFAARFAEAYANATPDARKEDYKTHITTAVNIILVKDPGEEFSRYKSDGAKKEIKINVKNMGILIDGDINGMVNSIADKNLNYAKAAPVVLGNAKSA